MQNPIVRPPGLSVVTAPRLEPLFERLAEAMAADPLPPLDRETILVAQNKGLRAWLTHELAKAHGCAASLDLRAPLTFATDLARDLVPGARPPGGERHPYDAGPLAWRLAPMLEALDDDPVWAPLRSYLDRTGGRAMPLAARLAALFDDYQVYRPEVLAGWARGEVPGGVPHGAWQAALWRRLAAEPTLDRAAGLVALAHTLRQSTEVGTLPRRLSVFGALLFPPLYWRVLAEVARHRPVTVYAVTAGPGPTTGPHDHPLLRALAGRTRDYWTVLSDLGVPPPERLAVGTDAAGDARPSALRQIQDALALDLVPDPVPLDPAEDRSVRVHDCHSATRELEALRDALLDAFAEIDGLRPSDVLVLVPDLDTYAPLVDAVFGVQDAAPGAGGHGLRLPYHVVGHPHAPALRVVEAFGKALRLHDGRVTASELLDLLGTPVVRRAAGIDEAELPRLRAWIREAGVCWGLDAERRGRFDVPEDDLHTWRFGLDRLLLGVMAGTDDLVLGHLPCDAAGLDGADLLGRFCEWAEALFSSLDAIDRPAPLDEWPARLVQFLDGVFLPRDSEEVEAVVFLREQAQELGHLHGLAGSPDAPVSFRAVRQHVDGAAGRFEQREPYLTGGVTVAHPLALRHAPHRVVAFLGLGDGGWPRAELAPDFDLIAQDPAPGDAAPRELEKQLFVDAVLAARDRLILSYVGRSQKDNAAKAASVCLDAFLDAAHVHWGADAERLIVRHRLQPFAADYFGGPLTSYAAQHRVRHVDAPGAFLDPDTRLAATDASAPQTLSLDDLASAWTNPSRYVARQRLRVGLDLDDDALRDDEPVTLGGLERWRVRQAVLDGLLDGLDDDALTERLLRGGLLPGGAPGLAWLRAARQEAAPLAQAVRDWGPTEPRPVEIEVGGVRLAGTAQRVNPQRGALRYRAGSVRQKDLVAAWVEHLALEATDAVGYTCTVGTADTAHFGPVLADHARAYLGALVRGWRRAQRRSLPLYEQASYAYAKALSAGELAEYADRVRSQGRSDKPFKPPEKAMKAARSAFSPFKGRPDAPPGDDDDAYVVLATRGRDPFVPETDFMKWALGLWAPLLHHRQDGSPA